MPARFSKFTILLAALAGCSGSFRVTASGTHVTISPAGPVSVAAGDTQAFTVTPASDYATVSTVGGTCPAGSWSGTTYTTGAIEAACSVSFSAALETFTVSATAPGGVTVTPSLPQTVSAGSTQAFTVTAGANYTLSTTVDGTCPAGSWSGSTYTTGPITADCTVEFGDTTNSYTVTATGTNVTITPSTPQTVSPNGVVYFVVVPNEGDTLSTTVGGTCPQGGWSGTSYTTGAITTSCTVTFSAM